MKKGFTLLEILLVVAAIAILAGIVIVALNPAKQLGDTNNARRYSDVNTILNAVWQYSIDNKGALPDTITTTETEICLSNAASCTGYIDLSDLTTNETYLSSIPVDPSATSTVGTGYTIYKSSNGRVTVKAPLAQENETISVTK